MANQYIIFDHFHLEMMRLPPLSFSQRWEKITTHQITTPGQVTNMYVNIKTCAGRLVYFWSTWGEWYVIITSCVDPDWGLQNLGLRVQNGARLPSRMVDWSFITWEYCHHHMFTVYVVRRVATLGSSYLQWSEMQRPVSPMKSTCLPHTETTMWAGIVFSGISYTCIQCCEALSNSA
jgi:hypothetical protein